MNKCFRKNIGIQEYTDAAVSLNSWGAVVDLLEGSAQPKHVTDECSDVKNRIIKDCKIRMQRCLDVMMKHENN